MPRIRSVELRRFTIYKKTPVVRVDVQKNVFCLAGANGLGKSSFVAALCFAITGGVAPPRGKIDQLGKYTRDARRYAHDYFEGRIGELDRDSATIVVEFECGSSHYIVTRQFFGKGALVELLVTRGNQKLRFAADDGTDVEEAYERLILEDTGLTVFGQFVLLYHFVFTFDERRHLLFWDQRASELVLYLALGLNPALARRADDLRKKASAANSLARNSQFQATSSRNQLLVLSKSLQGKGNQSQALISEYSELLGQRQLLGKERARLETQVLDVRLHLATASAEHMRVRRRYDDVFRDKLTDLPGPPLHKIIEETLETRTCQICGTSEPPTLAAIQLHVSSHRCPLCQSDVIHPSQSESWVETLKKIDEGITQSASRVTSQEQTLRRLENEREAILDRAAKTERRIEELETEHELSAESIEVDTDDLMRERIKGFEAAIDSALRSKDYQLEQRAQALAEFEPIRSQLLQAWAEAEATFVPRFRELAEGFIGLPLYVQLDEGSGMMGNAHLALSVNESMRRIPTQLSESQRFFLDIALRMVLVQYMTGDRGEGSMIIDTPEGALDIAYEARAGDLLAQFASSGDQLLMTANINSSQLLLRMAKKCGFQGMQFVRMTAWTTLSKVQLEEEGLFEDAFGDIEAALGGPR